MPNSTASMRPHNLDIIYETKHLVKLFAGVWMQDAWKDLEYCVRTGEPVFRKRGLADPFTERAQHPEEAANFDAAMADFTRRATIAVAAAYDFTSFRTVVDVGGGNGTLLIGILQANPHLHRIVFDHPHVVEHAQKQIVEGGLEQRCQAVGGDFFNDVPSGGDAYILKHVIHDWNDERALTILKNCRRAMAPNSTLLIVEGVYPRRIGSLVFSVVEIYKQNNRLWHSSVSCRVSSQGNLSRHDAA